jgi:hypothetical protein
MFSAYFAPLTIVTNDLGSRKNYTKVVSTEVTENSARPQSGERRWDAKRLRLHPRHHHESEGALNPGLILRGDIHLRAPLTHFTMSG